MLSDAQRHDLYTAALNTWGPGPADALMSVIPPSPWSDVARESDLAGIRGEMAELRGEMAELRGEMAELRAEVRAEIAQLRAHVDAQLPKLFAANVASMIGVAGLVLAAVSVGG
jgi:hypothetical protein